MYFSIPKTRRPWRESIRESLFWSIRWFWSFNFGSCIFSVSVLFGLKRGKLFGDMLVLHDRWDVIAFWIEFMVKFGESYAPLAYTLWNCKKFGNVHFFEFRWIIKKILRWNSGKIITYILLKYVTKFGDLDKINLFQVVIENN